MEKRVLGRGLSALIPGNAGIAKEKVFESKIQQGITIIPIDNIKASKYQPREDFDNKSIEDLSISIKEKGFIQPILVRSRQGYYELIAGERRLRAAKMLKLKELPAIIKEATDLDSLEISIIENVQRENLNPIDQARAYKRLADEFDITQDKIADTIGKDRATVANILRLLKLPQKIQEYVSRGTLSMSHARALLSLSSATEQTRLCTKVIKNDLSVRDTERYAKTWLSPKKKKISEKDPNLTSVEERLSQALGTKVKIVRSKKGGKIEIEFYSDKDLENIITLLKSDS
ncbi:MAG: ParB/RepB/Spo0J family partition protein [Candidatus Omnitrophica bacterium]|nr:ParB/RepB/Spo0J family partition protein [Candidatus Omnitrophota bacterium]MBU4457298.1 ParB/RepB/Spo0J family partition protein [Candidatus Omnitrophota bacterium]